jgi:hypothetical protein
MFILWIPSSLPHCAFRHIKLSNYGRRNYLGAWKRCVLSTDESGTQMSAKVSHPLALATRPGEAAADLSIMASWPGTVELAIIFFELLPTAHHAKRAPQIICTDSPRPKQLSHGDTSFGKRRMRGHSPRKCKVSRYYGRRQYIDNPSLGSRPTP